MSTQPTDPQDVVEGGPEPPPHPEDRPESQKNAGDRARPAPPKGGSGGKESIDKHDPPPWYQPESGQPGTA